MIDPSKHENQALDAAGQAGGALVEYVGKTDLSTWTAQEWAMLVQAIVVAFQDFLNKAWSEDPPL